MYFLRRLLGSWYDNQTIKLIAEILFVILPLAFAIRTFIFGFYQVPTGSMETTLLVGERFLADKLTYWFRKPDYKEIIAFDEPKYNYSKNPVVNLWQRYVSWNVTNWTKRVIGKPGDHIKGIIENGQPVVYLNGKKLDESAYVNKYPLIKVWKSNRDLTLAREASRESYHSFLQIFSDRTDSRSYDPEKPLDQQPFYKIKPNLLVRQEDGSPVETWPGTKISNDIFDVKLGDNEYWVMGDNRLGSSDSRFWGPLDGKLIHGRIIYRIWSMDSENSWLLPDLLNPIGFLKKVRFSRCFNWVY